MPKHLQNLIKLIATCLVLSSCAGIPKPVGHIGVIHTKGVDVPYINNFDMEKDFDDNGKVLPSAKGVHQPLKCSCVDLDKYVAQDAKSHANLVAAWGKLRKRYENCEAGQ
jgi:hypothetical protein